MTTLAPMEWVCRLVTILLEHRAGWFQSAVVDAVIVISYNVVGLLRTHGGPLLHDSLAWLGALHLIALSMHDVYMVFRFAKACMSYMRRSNG